MNYVPYFYEYEGIFPLLLPNNKGINGAESKRDSDPTLLMNQSNKSISNKFLYDFESGKIKHNKQIKLLVTSQRNVTNRTFRNRIKNEGLFFFFVDLDK